MMTPLNLIDKMLKLLDIINEVIEITGA